MAGNFRPIERVSMFRTMAAVAWDPPRDPTIYGGHDMDATQLLDWLERKRAETGVKLTPTHAVARAFALVLARNPGLNVTVRRGRLYQRERVDVFVQVAVPPSNAPQGASQKADLTGVLVRDAETKDVVGIAEELRAKAERIRQGDDPMLAATKKNLSWMPPLLMHWAIRAATWLSHDLGLDLSGLGIANDPFGSVMVTSLGMFGVGHAWAPHFPSAKGLGVVLVGAAEDGVKVIDGEIRIRKLMPVMVTLDHRTVDGFQASVLARDVRLLLEEPERLDDAP
ncbi:MAG: 2-oxo acid dehydrogenase subunit E2 [Deltaproteobacteria bacterium]|nr:2-oxo acid dehydrogenase subunit E2 [Deltaproteobacteria bacterium]